MTNEPKPENLEQVLDRVCEAKADHGRVSVGSILKTIGCRSFGPVLLFASLIMIVPGLSDIPGVPVMAGSLIFLVASQLLFGRDHIWLPGWLLRRSASRKNVERAVGKLRKPARFVDRFLRHRLEPLTKGRMAQAILAVSLLLSAATPLMELVPLSASLAGAALAAFGLALIAHDGVFALVAYAITAVGAGVVVANLV